MKKLLFILLLSCSSVHPMPSNHVMHSQVMQDVSDLIHDVDTVIKDVEKMTEEEKTPCCSSFIDALAECLASCVEYIKARTR